MTSLQKRPTVGGSEPTSELAKLDERSRAIFRQVVESYLATGDPVGSRNLSRHLPMTLSPASVRNVMADLEQAGLIYAPHTSAGRLPTQLGLRLFVDGLLEVGNLSDDERRQIEAQVGIKREKPLDQVLAEAGDDDVTIRGRRDAIDVGPTAPRLPQLERTALDAALEAAARGIADLFHEGSWVAEKD